MMQLLLFVNLEDVDFMHKNNITHWDLKSENILIIEPNCDVIKVSDFGLSKDFGKEKLRTSCDTPDYVSPEYFFSEMEEKIMIMKRIVNLE